MDTAVLVDEKHDYTDPNDDGVYVEDDDDLPDLEVFDTGRRFEDDLETEIGGLHNENSISEWLDALGLKIYVSVFHERFPHFTTIQHIHNCLRLKSDEIDFDTLMNRLDVSPQDAERMEKSIDLIDYQFVVQKEKYISRVISEQPEVADDVHEVNSLKSENARLKHEIKKLKRGIDEGILFENKVIKDEVEVKVDLEEEELKRRMRELTDQFKEDHKTKATELQNKIGEIEEQVQNEQIQQQKIEEEILKVEEQLKNNDEVKYDENEQSLKESFSRADIDPKFADILEPCNIKSIKDIGNLNIKALKDLSDFLMTKDFTKDDRKKLFQIWSDAQQTSEILHWFGSLGSEIRGDITMYSNVLYLLGIETIDALQQDHYIEDFFRTAQVHESDQEVFKRCRPIGIEIWLESVIARKDSKENYPKIYAKKLSQEYNCNTTNDLAKLYTNGGLAEVVKKNVKSGHWPKIKKALNKLVPRQNDGKPRLPRGGVKPPTDNNPFSLSDMHQTAPSLPVRESSSSGMDISRTAPDYSEPRPEPMHHDGNVLPEHVEDEMKNPHGVEPYLDSSTENGSDGGGHPDELHDFFEPPPEEVLPLQGFDEFFEFIVTKGIGKDLSEQYKKGFKVLGVTTVKQLVALDKEQISSCLAVMDIEDGSLREQNIDILSRWCKGVRAQLTL